MDWYFKCVSFLVALKVCLNEWKVKLQDDLLKCLSLGGVRDLSGMVEHVGSDYRKSSNQIRRTKQETRLRTRFGFTGGEKKGQKWFGQNV